MKKYCVLAILFTIALLNVYSLGFYMDLGLGLGKAWTFTNNTNIINFPEAKEASFSDLGVDLGLKAGISLKDSPVFLVLAGGSLGHRFYNSDDYLQINSYYLGPGIIYYPIGIIQIAASLGYTFNIIDTSLQDTYATNGGIAGDLSLAVDLGRRLSGFLLGVKGTGAVTLLEVTNDFFISTGLTIFTRYSLRKK